MIVIVGVERQQKPDITAQCGFSLGSVPHKVETTGQQRSLIPSLRNPIGSFVLVSGCEKGAMGGGVSHVFAFAWHCAV